MSVELPTDAEPVKVIQGDCLDVLRRLPDGCVDAVVTDPPYGINGGRGGDAKNYGKGKYQFTGWSDTEEYIASVVVPAINECRRVAKVVIVTPGVRCMSFYPRPDDVGCLWTPAAATHGPWGFTTFQPILYYGKDYRAGRGALPSGIQVTETAEKNGHPCPKTFKAWRWLVKKSCPPGSTILDPFAGSGTTGAVAMRDGYKALLIEREPAYCDIIRNRLSEKGNLMSAVSAAGVFETRSMLDLLTPEDSTR